jgi:very-short-patch-repair endonuclease
MSKAEELFKELWDEYGPVGYVLEEEYRFAKPRLWRFDFALPSHKIAVEIEGMVFRGRGRHQGASGYAKDCEKYNRALLMGWRVLRYTQVDLKKRPIDVITEIESLITMVEDGHKRQ